MVVACPHCGAHLDIAAPDAATSDASAPDAAEPTAAEPVAAAERQAVNEATAEPPASTPAAAPEPFPSFEPASAETAGVVGFDPTAPLPEVTAPAPIEAASLEPAVDNVPSFDPNAPTVTQAPAVAPEPVAAGVESTIFQGGASPTTIEAVPLETAPPESSPSAPAAPTAEFAPAPAEVYPAATPGTSRKAAPGTVSKRKFMIVTSYASAMTIAAIWLLTRVLNPTSNNLESLPDLEPAKSSDGELGYNVPEDASMPAGHLLTIGEERRFGNLKVTPVKVTRGPLEFEHYDPQSTATREPVAGVLKLWLKFENVSEDQSIAPLRSLLFYRDSRDIDNERSNTFVSRESEKNKDGSRLLVYDHNLSGDWNIVGLNFEEEIPPGESVELFVPTTSDGVDGLFGSDESLVWRVHFRKGYSPKNFGVTTLVEINFKEDDVAFDAKPDTENQPDGEQEKA
jgi:hypothetical protein